MADATATGHQIEERLMLTDECGWHLCGGAVVRRITRPVADSPAANN